MIPINTTIQSILQLQSCTTEKQSIDDKIKSLTQFSLIKRFRLHRSTKKCQKFSLAFIFKFNSFKVQRNISRKFFSFAPLAILPLFPSQYVRDFFVFLSKNVSEFQPEFDLPPPPKFQKLISCLRPWPHLWIVVCLKFLEAFLQSFWVERNITARYR